MSKTARFCLGVWGIFFLMYCPVLAALAIAAVVLVSGIGASLRPSDWLFASPIIYLSWLILTLAISAFDIQIWYLVGYRKPSRATTRDGFRRWFVLFTTLGLYYRGFCVRSFPLAHCLQLVPVLRWLVFLSYAPRADLGRDSTLFGFFYDPDLTHVGNGAIVGGGVRVSAHSLMTSADGAQIYASAMVTIGPRAVIGGESRIGPGVQIGADAVVEAGSILAPFTNVPANEIWGGNPAVFRSQRSVVRAAGACRDVPTDTSCVGSAPVAAADSLEETVRNLVALALGLPLANVPGNLSAEETMAWDSLSQMAILAALNNRLGIQATAAEGCELRSIPAIVKYVAARLATEAPAAPHSNLPRNPELLPLMDHDLVTCILAERDQLVATDSDSEIKIVIAATFTAEPLASSLKLWSGAFGIGLKIEFAGYDQVPQMLLSPESPFSRNKTGLNVVLVRPEDLLKESEETGQALTDDLLGALSQFADRSPGTLVVGTLPPPVSTFFAGDREFVGRCRANWHSRVGQIAGVELLEFAALVEQMGVEAARSSDMEVVARAPYSAALYRELGIALARLVRRRRRTPAKVLALDADGILWGGVVAEDGQSGIHLGPDHPGRAFQLFQQQVLKLKQHGIVLVLVSRNNPDDVWQTIENHPGMVLRRGDFAAARINWQPKSRNLRELARELNLGLDAFVFVDDDPANRVEVETNAPAVAVVPMPVDAVEFCRTISQLWCFDATATTAEDRDRTLMLQQEQQRQGRRDAAGDIHAYLQSLQLMVQMRRPAACDLSRVAQLTQKTNQFNLSLKRRSLPEIQALAAESTIFVVEAQDRFGDYGLIGVCVLKSHETRPDGFELDTFLLSCRALGRGVEEAVLYGLREHIQSLGGRKLSAPVVVGPRNQPVREFLARNGFAESTDGNFEHGNLSDFCLPGHVAWTGPQEPSVQEAA